MNCHLETAGIQAASGSINLTTTQLVSQSVSQPVCVSQLILCFAGFGCLLKIVEESLLAKIWPFINFTKDVEVNNVSVVFAL